MDKRSIFYRINQDTLYIRSTTKNNAVSEVEELHRTHYTMQKGKKIIEYACLRAGSTYQGVSDAMKVLFDWNHYPPIPINPSEDLYAFATESPDNHGCIWVITKNIKEIQERENDTIIHFINGKSLIVKMSKYRMEKLQAHLYKYHLYFRNQSYIDRIKF